MNEQSASRRTTIDEHAETDDESAPDIEMHTEIATEIPFDERFVLGHPYLQIQWAAYETSRRAHRIRAILVVLALVAVAIASAPYFYHLIPLVCFVLGVFRYNKWRKAGLALDAREKQLRAASWAIRDAAQADVKYTVDDPSDSSVPHMAHSLPKARVLVDAAKSVPKYCGSWTVHNWPTLSDSERCILHCDPRSSARAKVYHSTAESFALLTDTGIALWFV